MKVLDPNSVPKHIDGPALEAKWTQSWLENKVYSYCPDASREETFVVDTPPPTVSGSLHVGHIFSYTHADVIVRYQRMKGKNIYYPMGWDDNGLPTERRVQRLFHVKCDPHAKYDPNLKLEPIGDKKPKDPPKLVSRPNFIELCDRVTKEDEKAYMELWQRVGLSVDWKEEYATIDNHCRKLAQLSFMDLQDKGHVYSLEAPTMWDVDFQSAVAQAELEDRELPGAFHHIRFGVENSEESFIIATTRPELLPACVGVAAHPEDARYKGLFGKKAITPLFKVPVPIFPTELADPEKGTGILMVCTFGDSTDVHWWREQKLLLRQIIGRDGRLIPIEFGREGWESNDPEQANLYYEQLRGKKVKGAQDEIVKLLQDESGASAPGGAPLTEPPKKIKHPVKFFEKGDRPLEFITTRQWFVRLMDKKDELIKKGEEIDWHPNFMRQRYADWTNGLQLDWCVSRQRYFGVPIPVWYRADENAQPIYEDVLLPTEAQLPVDPSTDWPDGYSEDQRDQPNGFIAETDIFDTWFTSSLSPQIGSYWVLDQERHKKLFPSDIRPQSHEIIRTWAFYTIAKAMLHEQTIPWKNVVISGWILDPNRKKMSKSKGNVITPMHLIDEYMADGVRYWAASARLGVDTAFDTQVFKVGKRLVTKIYNASKFILSHKANDLEVNAELDRAFLEQLKKLVERATGHFENFDYAHALMETEQFFWQSFTDTYLEMAKKRAWSGDGSAVVTLRVGLSVLLRLLAPVLPYITEEVWSWAFAEETGSQSIHKAPWPSAKEFEAFEAPANEESFDLAKSGWAIINRAKTENGASTGRGIDSILLKTHPDRISLLTPILSDVMGAARADGFELIEDQGFSGDEIWKVEKLDLQEKRT